MVLVIDAMNALFRGTFGAGKKLSTPQGFEITPTYGFLKIVMGLLRRFPNVDKLVIASDPTTRNRVWRKAIYPDYKATRKDPDAKQKKLRGIVYANVPVIKSVFRNVNCGWFEDQEWEADDQIAMVAHHCNRMHQRCVIVSGDRDLLQLVELPYVDVCYPAGGDYIVVNHKNFKSLSQEFIAKKSKTPRQLDPRAYMFWRALVGDHSDNIKGVMPPAMAYVAVQEFYSPTLDTPADMLRGWWEGLLNKKKLTKKEQGILDLGCESLYDVVSLNWRLISLRPNDVVARDSYYGAWQPQTLDAWFRQVNFRSMLPGGDSYPVFTNTLGRLSPCLLW